MCLALISINQHPVYPLIILSNRDEFYERATVPAHLWADAPIYAGKDLEAGGTWLGVNQRGNVALLTNYRDPTAHSASKKSRGLLVTDYLQEPSVITPTEYIKKIMPDADKYNPFNLLAGTIEELVYYSNMEKKLKPLSSGLYGISNHLLETPWFKVLRAKELFHKFLPQLQQEKAPEPITELLFPILADRSLAPEALLPKTGIPYELEKALSSIFVSVPSNEYGTRCSTLLLFTKEQIFFAEKVFVRGEECSLQMNYVTSSG